MAIEKLLVGRREGAELLSLSLRMLDYRIKNGEIRVRRCGKKVLIPMAEIRRFAKADHGPMTSAAMAGLRSNRAPAA